MNAKGKPTGQNAKPGAGIYDHINKQYKPEMTDKEVIAMVKKTTLNGVKMEWDNGNKITQL